MNTIVLPIASLLIAIFLLIIFFRKRNIHNKETNVYSVMLIFNFIYSLLCILIYILAKKNGNEFLVGFFQKIYLIIMLIMIIFIIIYNINLLNFKENTKWSLIKIVAFSVVIFSILILFTPLNVINYADIIDGNGLSYNIAITATIIYFLVILISSIFIFIDKNYKSIPFLTLLIFYIIGLILRNNFPELLFETFFFSFMLLIMYHTIENPDLKMLNEVNFARAQAEKSNKVKSDFLSSMSHEIRTPLNAIVGFSELIKSSRTLKEAKENAEDILDASHTLLNLVSNVLDISQIEANDITLNNVNYNPTTTINNVLSLFLNKISAKHLDFDKDIDELPETLMGDEGKIKRILANLIDNAIKYTEIGYIRLSVHCNIKNKTCQLEIIVEDTGIGIDKKLKHHLFTNFNRSENHINSSKSGVGLGLSITKSLVDIMGGKITCESVLKKGTKFTVKINQKVVVK